MAIPKFYSVLRQQWPCVSVLSSRNCDALYIDMGSLLHACLQRSKSEAEVMGQVESFITELVLRTHPQRRLVLAMDGVPPLAKLKEQAARRKASKQTGLNPHLLTPGTKFMESLIPPLEVLCEELARSNAIDVSFSSWRSPGEGEWKIIRALEEEEDTIIFSADADLIVMTLPLGNISLIREPLRLRHRPYNTKVFEELKMSTLRNKFLSKYRTRHSVKSDLQTLGLAAMILGNDFIPRPHGLSVITDLNAICEVLAARTVEDATLNKEFMEGMAALEFLKFKQEHGMSDTEKNVHILTLELSQLSLKEKKSSMKCHIDEVERGRFKSWRRKHYSSLGLAITFAAITADYVHGIALLQRYYAGEDCLSKWTFDHPFVPMFSDMINHLPDTTTSTETSTDFVMLPTHQAALIIPFRSHYLLPLVYKDDQRIHNLDISTLSSGEIIEFIDYISQELDPLLSSSEKALNARQLAYKTLKP